MNIPKFFRSGTHSAEKSPRTVTGTMLDVIIALIPAAFAGVSVFGFRAAAAIALCIVSCVLAEYLWEKLMKRPASTGDLTAVVTGLLLAFSLPVSAPLWICPIGAVIAIIFAKQLFGGEGKSFLNPAITARIVLLLIFAGGMSSFTAPSRNPVDALSAATPLVHLNAIDLTGNVNMQLGTLISDGKIPNIINMLFGVRAGCIGETCAPALILGAVYLALRGVISLALPLVYIGTTALILLTASGFNVLFTAYELLGGALLLGAFFMATDPSTTPKKLSWKLMFGTAAGIITVLIRFFTPLPEGVAYSVLLINVACIFIEKKSIKLYIKPEKSEETSEAESSSEEPLAGDDAPVIPSDSTTEQNAAETSEEPLAGDDAPGIPSDSTAEQHAAEASDETLAGDDAPGVPTDSTTEQLAAEASDEPLAGDDAPGVPSDSTTEQNAVTASEEPLVGDDAPVVPTDSTTEQNAAEASDETLAGDDAPGVPTDSTTEQNAAEASEEPLVGDDAPGVPTDSTTEQHAAEASDEPLAGDDAPGIPTDSTPEQNAAEASDEPLAGDDAPGVPTDSTTEQNAAEASEEPLAGDDAPGIPTDSTTEQNAAEASDEPLVEDDAPGIPTDSTTEQNAAEAAPAKPVLINTLSAEPRFAPASMQKNKKKLGRKAKKKEKVIPDFNSPLPDVIPAFLKKDIENNKQSDN